MRVDAKVLGISMETGLSGVLPWGIVPESEHAQRLNRMHVEIRPPRRSEVSLGRSPRRAIPGPDSRPTEDIPESELTRMPILALVRVRPSCRLDVR